MKKCKLCEQFYKKYPLKNGEHIIAKGQGGKNYKIGITYSEVKCAFTSAKFNSVFDTDNWSCQTMIKLRELCDKYGYTERDDMSSGSIGVLNIPEDSCNEKGYIVINWYKERGRTNKTIIVNEDESPKLLDINTAEKVIKEYSKIKK